MNNGISELNKKVNEFIEKITDENCDNDSKRIYAQQVIKLLAKAKGLN